MSNRRTKLSSSLSPNPKRYYTRSSSSDLFPALDLSRSKKKRLLSTLNVNDGSSANTPLRISGGDGSSSNIDVDDDYDDDESMDIEDPDGFDGVDLDNYVEDTSYENLYPTQFNAEYDFNNQTVRPYQYGVAYNTNNLANQYDLRRFDDILKAKKSRSRYADHPPSTYGSVATFRATNPDTAFMRAYDQQEWTDNYQIGRAKRKRSDADMQQDKIKAMNMLRHINSHPETFNPSDLPEQNLIRAVENRIRHPPRFENNSDWNSNSLEDTILCIIQNFRRIIH
jgi:hypothetical protein